jgi:hypothetical protein
LKGNNVTFLNKNRNIIYKPNKTNKMKKIIVAYWRTKFDDLPYDNNMEFDYSVDMRNIIIEIILLKGYHIMLVPANEHLLIWIDNGKFRQR